MSTNTGQVLLRAIRDTCNQIDVPVPPTLTEAAESADQLCAAAAAVGPTTNPAQLALALLAKGQDPLKSKAVTEAIAAKQLAALGLPQLAAQQRESDLMDAIRDTADELLSAWADALQPAGQALADAHDTGITRLDQPTGVTGAALILWADARNALDQLAIAASGISSLRFGLRLNKIDDVFVYGCPARLAAMIRNTANQYGHPLPWALALNGCTVALPHSMQELEARTIDDGVVTEYADDDEHQDEPVAVG